MDAWQESEPEQKNIISEDSSNEDKHRSKSTLAYECAMDVAGGCAVGSVGKVSN